MGHNRGYFLLPEYHICQFSTKSFQPFGRLSVPTHTYKYINTTSSISIRLILFFYVIETCSMCVCVSFYVSVGVTLQMIVEELLPPSQSGLRNRPGSGCVDIGEDRRAQ